MAAGHILQTAGLAFLAEVGDASFFVAVILAIFCPWRGARSGKGLCVEYALVILGSVSALLLRVLLRRHELHVAAVTGELVPPLLAASGLAVLSALAFWHWSAARGDPEPAMGDRPGARPAYGGSFLGSFQAYNPAAYAKSESLLEQQPLLAGRMPERSHLTAKVPFIASMLLAFFVPFCVIFVLETGSQGIELEVVRRGSSLWALCGIVAATVIAVFTGFALERHVDDQVLLLLCALGLAALCISSLQMAALRYLAAAYAPKLSRSLRS